MNKNRLCKYCLEELTYTDTSSDFCREEHRAKWSGLLWLILFRRIDGGIIND